MEFEPTGFQGIAIVHHFHAPDARGVFVKPWVTAELYGIFGGNAETYFSYSERGVFRGLHYQRGGKAQKKYVVCLNGCVEDVALDLRPGSATYGKVFRKRLEGMSGIGVIIPEGFAHGIFAHEPSTIVNFCDKPFAPGDEGGVKWSSLAEIQDLPVTIISEKDAGLPGLEEEVS